jgi:hypothetical protein
VSINLPNLPPSTIVPDSWDLFYPFFNRTYEDIASTVNSKQNTFYPMAITSTAQNIFLLPTSGSYIIMVSGESNGMPTIVAALNKASVSSSGSVAVLGSQAGNVSPWSAATLTITSTSTNFQIKHSVSGQSGNFNIQFIGTQLQ